MYEYTTDISELTKMIKQVEVLVKKINNFKPKFKRRLIK